MPRTFIIRKDDGTEHGTYTAAQPRRAALKAANRCDGTEDEPITIKLRERGTKKIHKYLAWKKVIDAPEQRPDWMGDTINKAFVKKIGTSYTADPQE